MVRFIRQEAEEKAAEIAVTAEEVREEEREKNKHALFFLSFVLDLL